MENFDLNLDNYMLKDILKLFHLSETFDESDLKKAKRFVHQAHPDKSNLDIKFFIFFSNAYKKLLHVHAFISQKNKNQSIEYDKSKETISELQKNLLNDSNFQDTFNKMFNEVHIKDEQEKNGYGEWLKSSDDIYSHDDLEKVKKELKNKQITTKKHIEELDTSYNSSYYDYEKQSYSSNLFSKLHYEDLKQVHSETIIPVTHEDYKNVKKYKNVDELKCERNTVNTPLSLQQSQEFLNKQSELHKSHATHTAFELLTKEEEMEKKKNIWWAKYKQIKNL
tara:strand:- start:3641 stop:4480 length:840 start_codon:yes stop_codon:yes gene_type:complete